MASVQIHTESPISPAVHASSQKNPSSYERGEVSGRRDAIPSQQQRTPIQTDSIGSHFTANTGSSPTTPAQPKISPPTPTESSMPPSSYAPNHDSNSVRTERSPSVSSVPSSPDPTSIHAPQYPRSRSSSPRRDLPPPPKVGEKMKPASYYSPAPTPTRPTNQSGIPPALGIPPLSDSRNGPPPPASAPFSGQNGLLSPHPHSLLSPARTFGSPAQTPVTATMPQKNLEHPPGYVQNPYAADMTPEQRFANQHGPGSPSLGYNDSNPGFAGMKSPSGMFQGLGGMVSPRPGAGILNGNGKSDEGSMWGMVSGWAKGAGKKLSEVEGEVWRRINGE